MRLENNIPYKLYSRLNIKNIQDALTSLDDQTWHVYTKRQTDPFSPHKETTSIIMQYCFGEPEVDDKFLTMYPVYRSEKLPIDSRYRKYSTKQSFLDDFRNIEEKFIDADLNYYTKILVRELEKQFDGISGLVVYAKLPTGKNIMQHKDPGFYLSVVHRLHIPIFTNDKCYFKLDDNVVNMKEGYLYEINNLMEHSAANEGDCDRIHLIVDIIPNSTLQHIGT